MKKRFGFLLVAMMLIAASGFSQNIKIGWSENFDTGYSYYDVPDNWTVVKKATYGGHDYPNIVAWSNASRSKTNALEFKGGEGWIAMPAVEDGTDLNQLRLSFYYRCNSSNSSEYGQMFIGVMKDVDDDLDTWVEVKEVPYKYGGEGTWSDKWTVDLSEVGTEYKYIVLKCTSLNNASWYIDDMEIEAIPDCPKITGNLTYSGVTDQTATISFTDAEDQSGWVLYWKASSDENYTPVEITYTEYELTDLTPSTKYDVYVTRNCDGDEAEKSEVISFKTTAVLIDAPFEMTFEDDDDATHIEMRTSNNEAEWFIGSAENNTPDVEDGKAMYISKDNGESASFDKRTNNQTGYSFAVIPIKFDDAAEHAITFDYKCEGVWYNYGTYEPYEAKLRVYLVPAGDEIPESGSPTTGVKLLEAMNQADWQNFVYTTTSVANTTQQLVFIFRNGGYSNYGTSNNSIPPVIDNIKVTGSDCASPTDLASNNVLTESFGISWTQAGDVDGWRVYYKQTSDDEWESFDVTGNEPTATVEGLEGDHYYNAKVVALCGSEETVPTNTITVHTACVAIEDLPWETGFEDGYTLDCWEMVSQTNSSYNSNPFPKLQDDNTSIAYEGKGCIEFKTYHAGTQVIALPLFGYDLTQNRLNFMYRTNEQYSYGKGTFEAGYITDLNNAESFTALETLEATENNKWRDAEVYLTSVPEGARLALRYTQTGNNYGYTSWYVDNFKVSEQPSCSPITKNSVAGSQIEENSFTITFEDLIEEHNSWKVYYRPKGSTEDPKVVTTTEQSVELTDLSADTYYDVYVTVDCGDVESDPSYTASIKTACGAVTIDANSWTADFEDGDASLDCWTITEKNSAGFPNILKNNTTYAHGGSNSMEFRDYNLMIATPRFTNEINTLRVSFWVKTMNNYNGGNTGHILVGVMSDPSDSSTFEAVDTVVYPGNTNYFEVVTDFAGVQLTGDNNCVALKYETPNFQQNSWYIDDVKVSLIPSCAAPGKNSLTLAAKSSSSLTVAFTDGDESHSKWKVFYRQEGENTWQNVETTDKESTVLSGLEANSNYEVYVITVCDGADGDEPTNTFTFRTECGPMSASSIPWEEGFESGTDKQVPLCWTRVQEAENGGYTFPNIIHHNNSVRTGSKALEFKGGDCMIAFPEFDVDYHALRVRFYHRYNNSSSNAGKLYIGVVSNVADPSTFEQIAEVPYHYGNNTSTYSEEEEISLAGYTTTGNVRLAFKYVSDQVSSSWYVDDITLDALPPCSPIVKSSVQATEIGNDSAKITFEDPDASHTSWNVYYKENGSDDNYQSVTTSEKEATLTLSANTKYDVYVTVNCDEDGDSDPSKTISFTTKADPVSVPYSQDFESDNIKDFVFTTYTSYYTPNPWVIGSATAKDGEKSMYVGDESSNTIGSTYGSYSYAALNIQFGDKAAYTIAFDVKAPSTYTNNYLNVYLTSGEVPESGWPQDAKLLNDEPITNLSDWTNFSYEIAGIENTQQTLIFVWYNYNSCTPAAIDNLTIDGSDCARPYNLKAEPEDVQATIRWTNPTSSTSVDLYYIEADQANSDNPQWTKVSGITDSSYVITGLDYVTRYNAYLVSNCGANGTATSSTVSFKTTAKMANVGGGYTNNFETADELSSVDMRQSGVYRWTTGNAPYGGGDNKALYATADTNDAFVAASGSRQSYQYNSVYTVIPLKFGDKTEYKISFDYFNGSSQSYINAYLVPSSTEVVDGQSLDLNNAVTIGTSLYSDTWTTVTSAPLTGFENSVYQLVFAWRCYDNSTSLAPIAVDNLKIIGSDCAQPADLDIVDITENSAEITWQEKGNATQWTVYYKLTPGGTYSDTTFVSGETAEVDGSKVTATLSGLLSGAKYSAYVVADCYESSNPSDAIEFSTLGKMVNTFPYEVTFEDLSARGVFTFSGNCNDKWYIGTATAVMDVSDDNKDYHSMYISSNGGENYQYSAAYGDSYAAMKIQFGEDAEYSIDFDYEVGGRLTVANLNVYLVPADKSVSSTQDTIQIMDQIFGANSFVHHSAIVKNVAGKAYNLVFKWHNNTGSIWAKPAGIDNIRIVGSNCSSVANLRTEGRKQTNSMRLRWTDNSGDTQAWKVYYRPMWSITEEFKDTVVYDSVMVLEDLASATQYAIYVTALCGDEEESVHAYLENATECVLLVEDQGWFDGFDNYSTPRNRTAPMCWTVLKSSPKREETGIYVQMPSVITFANTGYDNDATSLEFNYVGTIATPVFANDIETLQLSFYAYKSENQYIKEAYMNMYVAGDIYDTTTWEPIWINVNDEIPNGTNTSIDALKYEQFTIPFNNIISKGKNKSIIIERLNYGNYEACWYFDNFRMDILRPEDFEETCNADVEITVEDAEVKDGVTYTAEENEATINWSNLGNASKWDYKINLNGKFVATNDSTATFKNLIPGTEYTAYVRSYCVDAVYDTVENEDGTTNINVSYVANGKLSAWDSIKFTTAGENPNKCDAVVDLDKTEVTENSISVSWTGDAESYQVAITKALDASYQFLVNDDIQTTANSQYTFSDLLDSTDYRVYVRQVCEYNNSEWDSIDVTTLKKYLAPEVTTTDAINIDSTSATLTGSVTWNSETPNKKGFEIRMASEAESAAVAYESSTEGTNFNYNATGLKSDTKYSYRAYAEATDGTKFYGSWTEFKTLEWIPNPPVVTTSAMAESDYDSTSAVFNATVTLGDESLTGKGFVYWTGNDNPVTVNLTAAEAFTYKADKVLKDAKEYSYTAFATTAKYTVYGDTLTFTTKPSPNTIVPPSVTTLDATGVDSVKATLNGKAVKHEQGAEITEVGFFYGKFGTALNTKVVSSLSGEEFNSEISGLDAATAYAYYAYAIANGDTVKGNNKQFTTVAETLIPPTVTTLDAVNVDSTTATLSGNIVKGNQTIIQSGFRYFVQGADTSFVTSQVVEGDFTANIKNLTPASEYVYFAYAVTDSGEYRGEDKMFTTLEGPKVYPTVQTYSASTVTESGATLNGRVKAGNVEVIEQGFAYKVKEAEGDYTMVTVTSAEEQISYDVTGLLDSTVYTYYAYAKVNATTGDSIIRSENDVEFTTLKKTIVETDPVVRTADASGIDSVKATLNATVTVTETTKAIVSSGFMYRKATDSEYTTVEAAINNGTMTYELTGLTPDTEYQFAGFVNTADGHLMGDIKTFKTLATSGLAEIANMMLISTYPNPTTSDATLRVEGLNADAQVIMTNTNGQIISTKTLAKGQTEMRIETSGLAAGVYYIRVISDGVTRTEKLIKE